MKKRLLAILICVIIVASVLPSNAFAMLGALTPAEDVRHKTITVFNAPPGYYESAMPAGRYYMLYNDYLCFILRPDGCTTTVPTRKYKQYIDSMHGEEYSDDNGEIMKNFPVTETHQFKYFKYTFIGKVLLKDSPCPQNVTINEDTLLANYSVGEGTIDATVSYRFVGVNNGAIDGTLPLIIEADENDNGRGWGIKLSSYLKYNESEWNFPDNDDYRENGVDVDYLTTHLRFAKQSTDKEGGLMELSYQGVDYYQNELVRSRILTTRKVSRVDIPYSDVSMIVNGTFIHATEAFTRSFGSDNQFIALGSCYYNSVEGHTTDVAVFGGGEYGEHYSYNALCAFPEYNGSVLYLGSTFTTYSTSTFFPPLNLGPQDNTPYEAETEGLWGYRDLYTGNEYDVPADPEFEWNVPGGNKTLGIVKKDDSLVATPAANIETLTAAYGDDLVAAIRGTFALNNATNEYIFLDGVAALAPTVVARWDESTGCFSVSKSGTITAEGVSLSCPVYEFYTPKEEGGLSFDLSDGFLITIDPLKNKSCFNVEIPGATAKITGAEVQVDGRLAFCGEMSIYTPLVDIANIELTKVGMDFQCTDHHFIDGIEASGSVDMGELMGAMASNVSAEINTFDGEEKYGFELDLNIPQLFEAEAELTLVRLKNGSLAPDALMFALSIAAAEIPIIPGAFSISGVGGGFRDLAETLNDDPYSLPPLKVSLSADATVVEAVSGRCTLTAGLGYCSMQLSNATLFDVIPLGVESLVELFTADEQHTYQRRRYNGIFARYKLDTKMHLPMEQTTLLSIEEAIEISSFVGVSGSSMLFEIDGDGSVKCAITMPKKINIFPLPDEIAGFKITSAEVQLKLSGTFAANFGKEETLEETASVCAKGIVNNATLSYQTKILGLFNTYIVASAKQKKVTLSIDILGKNYAQSFGSNKNQVAMLATCKTKDGQNYDIYAYSDSSFLGSTDKDKAIIGDTDLLASNGVTMEQITPDESQYTVSLSDTAKNGQLMFILKTKDANATLTAEQLKDMFIITKPDGTTVPLTFSEYNSETGEQTVVGNSYTSMGGYDSILDETVCPSVVVMLPDNNETYTIKARNDSDAPVAFDIECVGAELPESITEGNLDRLREGDEYAVRAYLTDSDGNDNFVGEKTLTSVDNGKNITSLLPVSADSALDSLPTGSYTLKYDLYRMVRGIDNNNEPAVDELGNPIYYYIDVASYVGSTVQNTNPYQLSAPTNVTLVPAGSEVLHAEWTAPSTMPSSILSGYNVAVEQLVDGKWVDTGARYNINKDELGNVPTSVSMAITANGVDDGLLTAGNTYRVNVCAIADVSYDDNGETKTAKKTGIGAYSQSVYLAPATPPTLSYAPAPIADGNNVKSMYVKRGSQISINATPSADKMISSVTVTNLLDRTRIAVNAYNSFIVPEFDGSLTIEILVCDNVGDKTIDYITLLHDDVAPVITLSSNSIVANADGSYTISGVTEPGAKVMAQFTTIPVAADGSFTYTGQLDLAFERSATIAISSTDLAGNTDSDMLSVGMKLEAPVITPESGTYYELFDVSMTCSDPTVEIRYTLDGSEPTEESALYTEAFEISESLTIKAKAFMEGMEPSETASCVYTYAAYSVVFMDWDDNVLKTEEVRHGEAATAPPSPTREGYTFIGWDKDFSCVTEDMTITACYDENLLDGDVNADGEINTGDAVLILQVTVELSELSIVQNAAADYNHDGEINSGDAVAVLKFCVSTSINAPQLQRLFLRNNR